MATTAGCQNVANRPLTNLINPKFQGDIYRIEAIDFMDFMGIG